MTVARTIEYTTNLDGWGAVPTDDEQVSFCAYVVHRLEQTYPGSDVTADVDADALTSVVHSSDDSLDCEAVRAFVGNEIWSDWCGGARAPATYTYTIFDANPAVSSGTAWPSHEDIEIEATSPEEAIDAVRDVMSIEAAGLNTADGYEVGQRLYAIVWDADTIIVGEPTYDLTDEDLG